MPEKTIFKRFAAVFAVVFLLYSSGCVCAPSRTAKIPENFVYIADVIPDPVFDIRYATSYNFVGTPIDGYHAPKPSLTREAAAALARAAEDLRKQGYRILVYDAYRPQKAVTHFVRWINDPEAPGEKAFFPNLTKGDLLKGRYIDARSGHSRGSVIDLTLARMDGTPVDMGGTFDLFDEVSHPDSKQITPEQRRNRTILKEAMEKAGFIQLDTEWWHFRLKDEPYPDTYYDFDVQ
ncbi:MAG: M15 family metallopeptidase [Victivallaceae bacterium]